MAPRSRLFRRPSEDLTMNPGIPSALPAALALALGLGLGISGCSQLTTSKSELSALQSAADRAESEHLECLKQATSRYLATGEGAEAISRVARKDCSATRDRAASAQGTLLGTRYILAEPQVAAALKALDEKGEAAISRQVLDYRTAQPAAAPVAAAAPARPASGQPAAGPAYLACMQAQGERYAAVNEGAEVVAEVAHSRCAASLGGGAPSSELERQGRALVMGLVLDRKAQQQ
ncbi:MAG: hypothetical protein ABI567_00335 [Gammaproteobacteria bacterium]